MNRQPGPECIRPAAVQMARSSAGFTLVEVLVAVVILAIVAMVGIQSSRSLTHAVASQSLKTRAHWVVANEAYMAQINHAWYEQTTENHVTSQGLPWMVRFEVESLPDPSIKKVTVGAYPMLQDKPAPYRLASLVYYERKPL